MLSGETYLQILLTKRMPPIHIAALIHTFCGYGISFFHTCSFPRPMGHINLYAVLQSKIQQHIILTSCKALHFLPIVYNGMQLAYKILFRVKHLLYSMDQAVQSCIWSDFDMWTGLYRLSWSLGYIPGDTLEYVHRMFYVKATC